MHDALTRRRFLRYAMLGLGGLAGLAQAGTGRRAAGLIRQTRLDTTLGIDIPVDSSIRVIAHSSRPVLPAGDFLWHSAPDGGACFPAPDGGWVYVSNSEMADGQGGVGAIRFDSGANIVAAYPILADTSRNCAGGPTPWRSWLSCEENGEPGQVYECDPFGKKEAMVRPALGSFNHEAAAVDPANSYVYMTEDVADGCFYRFKPYIKGDLAAGLLEVAVPDKGVLRWRAISDPAGSTGPLRYQVQEAARFAGGEGIVYHDRQLFFTTKFDNVVWRYDIATGLIDKLYAAADYRQPLLTGVDNIEVAPSGELLIAEDGGDMQIIALDHQYNPHVLLEIHGQERSEITGPAFSPDGRRLYFSSQRGKSGRSEDGMTYELRFI